MLEARMTSINASYNEGAENSDFAQIAATAIFHL
jgi:hypothetical protein